MKLHIHHIQPKYLIGEDNSPDNLTPPISVELHAALHKDLYDHYGNTQDWLAWKGLLGISFKGIQFTPEVRKKMSLIRKGIILSQETKNRISKSKLGSKHSKETCKKMSEIRKGIKASDETKRKLSESHKGHITSKETKKKISDACKGRKFSEETKKKMSKSKIGNQNAKISK
jgi:hypothetical protein